MKNAQKTYFLNKFNKHLKAINFDYNQRDVKEKLKEIFSQNMRGWVVEVVEYNIRSSKD